MSLKILLVKYDDKSWATSHRAENLKKRLIQDEVSIVTNLEFKNNADELLKQYDIVHILYSGGLSIFYDIFKKNPNKIITSVASHRSIEEWWDKKEVMDFIYKNSAAVIAFSKKLQKLVKGSVYIPNGVDERVFKPNYAFNVGFVGIRDEYKGFHLIEEACKRLGVNFLHDGNRYPHKIVPHHKMPEIYSEFDCLVIASLGEGCHNPTLEALAMNIPVISTNTGIADELDGVVLVERSVEGLMKGIRKVYARKQILEKYSWKEITKQYREIYIKCLRK